MLPVKVRDVVFDAGRPKMCIPVTGKTPGDILEAVKAMTRSAAEVIEWRADFYTEVKSADKVSEMAADIRQAAGNMPVLFTVRTAAEGGELSVSDEEYGDILCHAAAFLGVDMIDLEAFRTERVTARVVKAVHAAGKIVIMSYHDFKKTPSAAEICDRLMKMQHMGADIVKIAVMPQSKSDVLTLMQATVDYNAAGRCPAVTMSMGAEGMITRIAGEFTGSVMTFAMLGGHASAPGQMAAEAAGSILRQFHGAAAGKKLTSPVFLVGFMGTGKTTTGRQLARLLHTKLKDTDAMIEAQEGMKISEIFEQYGEAHFRQLETELLKQLKYQEPAVIACGGGIVLCPENAVIMKHTGTVVLLEAAPETIYQRLKSDTTRPLLRSKNAPEAIKEMMAERAQAYDFAADIRVCADGPEAKATALAICGKLKIEAEV